MDISTYMHCGHAGPRVRTAVSFFPQGWRRDINPPSQRGIPFFSICIFSFYSKGRMRDREIFHGLVQFPRLDHSKAKSQEPELRPGLPHEWQGPQALNHHPQPPSNSLRAKPHMGCRCPRWGRNCRTSCLPSQSHFLTHSLWAIVIQLSLKQGITATFKTWS